MHNSQQHWMATETNLGAFSDISLMRNWRSERRGRKRCREGNRKSGKKGTPRQMEGGEKRRSAIGYLAETAKKCFLSWSICVSAPLNFFCIFLALSWIICFYGPVFLRFADTSKSTGTKNLTFCFLNPSIRNNSVVTDSLRVGGIPVHKTVCSTKQQTRKGFTVRKKFENLVSLR